jgi:dsRNA-specific ribonuclease
VWRSEKNGIKDAAFEAYLALYRVGLVNDNLLPLLRHDAETDEFSVAVEKQSALVTIHELHNPWVDVARAWSFPATEKTLGRPVVTLYDIARGTHISMEMIIPIELPDLPPLKLYWDAATEMVVNIGPWVLLHEPSEDQLGQIHDGTRNLLKAAFGHRFQVEQKQLVVLFTPPSFDHHIVVVNEGDVEKVRDLSHLEDRGASMGLIRHIHEKGVPYIFEKWLDSKPPANMVKHPYSGYDDVPVNAPHLALSKVSRREDFLNPTGPVEIVASDKPYSYVLPVDACVIDSMTFQLVQLGRLLPSIMHYISTYLIAMHLSKTILSPISFPDLTLVLTAITASSASRQTNYQRLEFLGDSILKTCTSLQLLALYPNWHEGYLSFKKDRLVANSRLARAAIECGLDKYVSTKPFTGRKWRPLYISNILAAADQEGAKRNVSSKVLADVVESLIGASYLSGGMSAALSCISIFLPELPWRSLSLRREEVFAVAPFHVKLPAAFGPLTTMLDYRFNKPVLLLDALSHASCSSGTASWERLEFLGDAILDNIIVESIFGHKPQLSHVQMHRLRTAVVNADFLAFICLEFSVDVEVGIVVPVAGANTSPPPKETQREGGKAEFWKPASLTESKPLWAFMRHGSQKLGAVQRQMSTRHASLRAEIKTALHTSQSHPWALLAKLQAPKFYSDLIESVLGALYIDSGNLDVCTAVLNKMGVMPYLERVLREGVHVIHPKEELGILADQEPVAYRVQLNRGIVGGKEHREWTCQVMVGEKEVASVGGGVGREEIQVCAAERAVATLKAQRKEIDENEGTQREGALLEGQASDVEQDFGGVRLNVESDGDVDMGS